MDLLLILVQEIQNEIGEKFIVFMWDIPTFSMIKDGKYQCVCEIKNCNFICKLKLQLVTHILQQVCKKNVKI